MAIGTLQSMTSDSSQPGNTVTQADNQSNLRLHALQNAHATKAVDRSAAVTRQQYQDYLDRYVPIEDKLIERIGNQDYQREQVGNAVDSATSAYQSGMATVGRNLSRYGVNMDHTQSKAFDRKVQMGETLSSINAANTSRMNLEQQDTDLSFGMANYGRNTLAGANEMFGNAAAAETSRNATNASIAAQNKAANQQAVMAAASMALMFM